MVAGTIVGIVNGNVGKYLAPIDGNYNICGYDSNVKDYPKLYLPVLAGTPSEIFGSGVCVKECPKKNGGKLECAPAD